MVITRRCFLERAAGAVLSGAALTGAGPLAARYSGGIEKIGLQLYTLRNEMEKDFEGTLDKVSAIGYREVEFAGYFGRTPRQVKAALSHSGLSAPSSHVSLQAMRSDWSKALESARMIGHRYLVLAYLLPDERKSLDDYKKLAELMGKAGEDCRRAGLQFAYHNHDFEFQPLEGVVPYDLLLKETDPKLVKLELDLYWIAKAGQEPAKYFAMYPKRFELFHVKDMDKTPKKHFTEVGRGVIDFKRIFAQSKQSGVKHYFVEQDETPGSPFDSIKVSYDYLKQMKF
ncbi:MAG TPA: sugar phosphate isomerase/epimerase [Blastocatellia bacterium]|jgi:sugar phosphate isomerase/epimerase|nr:sugar phosphate isomerase/epimerase [Blastocatellia bacterium]